MATKTTHGTKRPRASKSSGLGANRSFTDEAPYPDEIRNIGDMLGGAYAFICTHLSGNSGKTYQLRSRLDGSIYCLKSVKPGFSDLDRVRETLKKEVEILRPLSHRCLPRTYEFDFQCQPPFYVCTFHPGKTFAQFRDSKERLTLSEATTVITSLIDTLEYLHGLGRTHCDLHEENLLLGPNVLADGLLIIDLGSGHRLSATRPKTVDRGHLAHKLIDDMPEFRREVERLSMQDS
jgi:serine/threonine protein kinase